MRIGNPPAAYLFLLIGTVGGAIGGGAVGVHLGRRSVAVMPPVVSLVAAPTPPVASSAPKISPALPDGGIAPSEQRDGGTVTTAVVCVEVRDAGDRPVPGAAVRARPLESAQRAQAARGDSTVGELGVYSGALPFPEDIIAGQYSPLGRPSSDPGLLSGAGALRTDDHGHVCVTVVAPAHIQLSAAHDDRSAAVELFVRGPLEAGHAAADAARSPLAIVLRLDAPLDALCALSSPPATAPGENASEPVSDSLGPDITGRVVDGRGFGLPAVRVDAGVGASRGLSLSDASGAFRIAGLPRGPLRLQAQLKGYAPLFVNRRADEPRSELVLTLRSGGGIAGSVRDGRRGGLPTGTTLVLVSAGEGGSSTISLSSDGSFRVTGLPVGNATLRARAPGYAPLEQAIQIVAGEAPDQVTVRDLRLELEPGSRLNGQLRGPQGAVVGAAIEVHGADGSSYGRALTDEHGDFHLNDLPSGHLRISATSSQGRIDSTVELPPGGEERVYLELRP